MNALVEELFHQVVDLPPDTRNRFFTERGVDGDIRRQVEALLAFEPGASALLLSDVRVAASRALPQVAARGGEAAAPRRGRAAAGTVPPGTADSRVVVASEYRPPARRRTPGARPAIPRDGIRRRPADRHLRRGVERAAEARIVPQGLRRRRLPPPSSDSPPRSDGDPH